MTTASRSYINQSYDQYVDDECLMYKSVPMAIVNKLLKVNHSKNDYDGIKQNYNIIPPRPINILALATSICRINNLPYTQVDEIVKKIIKEEITDVESFVSNKDYNFENSNKMSLMKQDYVAEKPIYSTGNMLVPNQMEYPKEEFNKNNKKNQMVSLILGDYNPTTMTNDAIDGSYQTDQYLYITTNPSISLTFGKISERREKYMNTFGRSKKDEYPMKLFRMKDIKTKGTTFITVPDDFSNEGSSKVIQTELTKPAEGRYMKDLQTPFNPKGMYSSTKEQMDLKAPQNRFRTNIAHPINKREEPDFLN